MNEEAIKADILRVLIRIVPEAQEEEVDPDATFRDQFDIDSLDFLNFVLSLEEAFGVKVPETAYPGLGNLSGAVSYVASLLSVKAE